MKKRVKIDLVISCECGVETPVKDFGSEMRVSPGQMSESGTYFPGEIELHCPVCKGVDDSRTC